MQQSQTQSVSIGPGLPTILTAIFVTLKLTDVIDWSWWWVLSPLLITGGIMLIFLAIAAVFVFRR